MALDEITTGSQLEAISETGSIAAFKSRRTANGSAPRAKSRPVMRRQPEPTGLCFDALSDRLAAMRSNAT